MAVPILLPREAYPAGAEVDLRWTSARDAHEKYLAARAKGAPSLAARKELVRSKLVLLMWAAFDASVDGTDITGDLAEWITRVRHFEKGSAR